MFTIYILLQYYCFLRYCSLDFLPVILLVYISWGLVHALLYKVHCFNKSNAHKRKFVIHPAHLYFLN